MIALVLMKQYIDLIDEVIVGGHDRVDRTGIGSRFIWGTQMHFDLSSGFPATTVRPVPLRWAFEETMFFLRGETDTKLLEEKGVTIWKGNTTREFLDSRGLNHLPIGNMGKGYGYQWRNFGGTERGVDGYLNTVAYGIEGIDQINDLIDGMISDPDSRRHIVSAWNPMQLNDTALPPCHLLQHYNISNGKLNSLFWMRSNDVIYGLPFNIAQYAFINLFIAKLFNLQPGTLVYQCSDAHIYINQLNMAIDMLERFESNPPKQLPTIEIDKPIESFDDILSLEWDDIEVIGYDPHPDFKDKPKMAV